MCPLSSLLLRPHPYKGREICFSYDADNDNLSVPEKKSVANDHLSIEEKNSLANDHLSIEEKKWDQTVTGVNWNLIKQSKTHTMRNFLIQRITLRFQCDLCAYHTGPVSFLEEKYYKLMNEPDYFWENNLVQLFLVLTAHCFGHLSDIYFVAAHTHHEIGTPVAADTANLFPQSNTSPVPDGVSFLVTIAWAQYHFVLLIFDLKKRTVFVRDGLSYPLVTWDSQIWRVLKTCNLQDQYPQWTVEHDNTGQIKQDDRVNCGPITCFQLYRLYQPLAAERVMNEPNFANSQLRKFITNLLRLLIR
jgi:hypothetical protein